MCLFQLQIACLKTFDLGRYWRCLEPQVRGMLSIKERRNCTLQCIVSDRARSWQCHSNLQVQILIFRLLFIGAEQVQDSRITRHLKSFTWIDFWNSYKTKDTPFHFIAIKTLWVLIQAGCDGFKQKCLWAVSLSKCLYNYKWPLYSSFLCRS